LVSTTLEYAHLLSLDAGALQYDVLAETPAIALSVSAQNDFETEYVGDPLAVGNFIFTLKGVPEGARMNLLQRRYMERVTLNYLRTFSTDVNIFKMDNVNEIVPEDDVTRQRQLLRGSRRLAQPTGVSQIAGTVYGAGSDSDLRSALFEIIPGSKDRYTLELARQQLRPGEINALEAGLFFGKLLGTSVSLQSSTTAVGKGGGGGGDGGDGDGESKLWVVICALAIAVSFCYLAYRVYTDYKSYFVCTMGKKMEFGKISASFRKNKDAPISKWGGGGGDTGSKSELPAKKLGRSNSLDNFLSPPAGARRPLQRTPSLDGLQRVHGGSPMRSQSDHPGVRRHNSNPNLPSREGLRHSSEHKPKSKSKFAASASLDGKSRPQSPKSNYSGSASLDGKPPRQPKSKFSGSASLDGKPNSSHHRRPPPPPPGKKKKAGNKTPPAPRNKAGVNGRGIAPSKSLPTLPARRGKSLTRVPIVPTKRRAPHSSAPNLNFDNFSSGSSDSSDDDSSISSQESDIDSNGEDESMHSCANESPRGIAASKSASTVPPRAESSKGATLDMADWSDSESSGDSSVSSEQPGATKSKAKVPKMPKKSKSKGDAPPATSSAPKMPTRTSSTHSREFGKGKKSPTIVGERDSDEDTVDRRKNGLPKTIVKKKKIFSDDSTASTMSNTTGTSTSGRTYKEGVKNASNNNMPKISAGNSSCRSGSASNMEEYLETPIFDDNCDELRTVPDRWIHEPPTPSKASPKTTIKSAEFKRAPLKKTKSAEFKRMSPKKTKSVELPTVSAVRRKSYDFVRAPITRQDSNEFGKAGKIKFQSRRDENSPTEPKKKMSDVSSLPDIRRGRPASRPLHLEDEKKEEYVVNTTRGEGRRGDLQRSQSAERKAIVRGALEASHSGLSSFLGGDESAPKRPTRRSQVTVGAKSLG
jgi:hypothetical protein